MGVTDERNDKQTGGTKMKQEQIDRIRANRAKFHAELALRQNVYTSEAARERRVFALRHGWRGESVNNYCYMQYCKTIDAIIRRRWDDARVYRLDLARMKRKAAEKGLI